MSVRRETRTDPKTGRKREFLIVDVCVQHPDGRTERVRRVSPIQTKKAAKQYEAELRHELLHGTHGKEVNTSGKEDGNPTSRKGKKVPTLKEFAREFIRDYAVANNKSSEIETKQMILTQHLVPALGNLRLDQIGPKQIEKYKADKLKKGRVVRQSNNQKPKRQSRKRKNKGRKQSKGLSRKTLNNHLAVLRKLLDVAVEWEILAHLPRIKWLKVEEPEFDFLTFREADRLIESADPEFKAMIHVALKSGLRLGELRGLTWDSVDLVGGKLVVRRAVVRGKMVSPKSGKKREVPLCDATIRVLKAHRHLKSKQVFCQADGKALTKNMCKWPLWRACRRAGLRQISWHVTRHSYASHLAMLGVPLKVIQELLGHARIDTSLRYSHLSPDVKRDAVQLLGRTNGNMTATAPFCRATT